MQKVKKPRALIGILLAAAMVLSTFTAPSVAESAYDASGAAEVTRGGYYDLPETIESYAESGKTIEFDLNTLISDSDVCKFGLYNGTSFVSSDISLKDGENGLSLVVEPLDDGWYHYAISLATVPRSDTQGTESVNRLRARTTFPSGTMINNITVGVDVRALPEAFTEDYDTVTLADLSIAGTDHESVVSAGTYTYSGTSETKSVIVRFGWDAKLTAGVDDGWKIAIDTYWNEKCMVWFRGDGAYAFFPSDKSNIRFDAVTEGRHDVEFGRLRVTAGPNYGMDYVFIKIDGEVKASVYTDYYQTEGGYLAHNGKTVSPSYTVCFLDKALPAQRFTGFAKPDVYSDDIDYINIGEIVPGGVVKDTIHDNHLGYTYPCELSSPTSSTVVKFVLKTGKFAEGSLDGSVMVVDIGGNCGFCRSYIQAGVKNRVMFGWEIEGCSSGTMNYTFEENSWYAFEQGRVRVAEGVNAGKDYVYLKINGEIVSSFYGNPSSRPLQGKQIYVEATQNFQVIGYNEVRAKYYVDGELFLDQLAQKGLPVRKPADPKKEGEFFLGWYTAKTGGALFDFANSAPTGDIELYARFTTETVQVTFDPANGSAASTITAGKDSQISQPADPVYSGGEYEYIFAGWKNETTGNIFDFGADTVSADTIFTAQYSEKEYSVSYYALGKLVEKVSFVLSDPTVEGKEPAVPAIPNAAGVWEDHALSGLTGNMTVNAVYDVTLPSAGSSIKLGAFDGGKVYLNTDTVHDYLSLETSDAQTAFVKEFCSTPHEYQDHQNISFGWTGGSGAYTVYFADNTEFDNAFILTSDKASLTGEAGVFVPGKTYYWFVSDGSSASAVDSFTAVNAPVRYISSGSVINMRDLGGQMNADGGKVRYGLVYRGAAMDEFTSHIDDASRGVFNYLGMKSEIELRGGMNHDYTGWDDNNPNVNYIVGAAYQEIFSLSDTQKAQYKAAFENMADESNYPFYFHCSAGADRTGTFAYLLYGLMGIPYEDIRPEYELTSFSAIGLRAASIYSGQLSMDGTHARMLESYGGGSDDLQAAVRKFLTEYVGVGSDTLDAIVNILLEADAEPNEAPHLLTVDVLGKKTTYQAFDGIYFMPESPSAMGKLFKGFYEGSTQYTGYADRDMELTAVFEDIEYEPYDQISLIDLGVQQERILNTANTTRSYVKTASGGGRLFQFILEPVGDMNKGDGPQLALTNDWSMNSRARVWFQTNTMSHVYYSGKENTPPDISKTFSLEAGKQYDIVFAIRVMKNAGYEGKKVLEITVDGELLVQYIGCTADLSGNTFYFHGGAGSAWLINKPVEGKNTLTVDVLGEKYVYQTFSGVYFMPEPPAIEGKLFRGFYNGNTPYNGYADTDLSLTARYEDMEFEPYDQLSLLDLGIQEDRIKNQTNTTYTYVRTAKSGGRLLQFRLEPIGTMNGGDGPQLALTNDWEVNSRARVWFQTNTQTHVYYSGKLGTPPDVSKTISLESGKQYDIVFSVRILKNSGYEGKKVLEVTVDGELLVQYIGCTASLDNNTFYFHGGTGAAWLINKPVEGKSTLTVDVLGQTYRYQAFAGTYFMPEPPAIAGKIFRGFYSGSTRFDGNVKGDISLTARYEDMEFEPYDQLSLIDLGIQEDRIKNQTNTTYTYVKTAKSGGRLLQFRLEPIGDMNGGDGPQLAVSNDWSVNSRARVWFQTNTQSHVYYAGKLGTPPDVSKAVALEAGKQYDIVFSIRILKNSGYEGKKVLEVTVDGELLAQYIGCRADLDNNTFYFHGGTGAAWLINKSVEGKSTLTVDVQGQTYRYQAFAGTYFMPEPPAIAGKLFRGFYSGNTRFDGNVKGDISLTARYEDMTYEPYDTISLRDLGIQEDRIKNKTASLYTYVRTAESGGRLLQFKLEPIGNMNNGDGPHVSFTNDWSKNGFARVWFQSNTQSHVYYSGKENVPADISKNIALEPGKTYDIRYSIRVLTNSGYEGQKVFEITVDGELLVQYIGCQADIDNNTMFFHGGTGSVWLINKPVYRTVRFYDDGRFINSVSVQRGGRVKDPGALEDRDDMVFAGWFTELREQWHFDTDQVYMDLNLSAGFRKRTYPILLMIDDVLYKRIEVAMGETAGIFDIPEMDGYEFDRWLTKDGAEYDMSTPVTGPVTLYASFKQLPEPSAPKPSGSDTDPQTQPGQNEDYRVRSSNLSHILFSGLGLLVIAGESGTIIYKKRRNKSA
ncbi:MAG: tyrosine-protein phosphatase [Lachnospiraceae bacterium]|nr:tyrosine-protein phosphatase [Lachnospiraceae bacterium]